MENEFQDIVKKMVIIRQLFGMTQKELADAIGYSLSTVKKIECGYRTLSTDYFRTFCLKLGISADFLLSDDMIANSND